MCSVFIIYTCDKHCYLIRQICALYYINAPRHEKSNMVVSDQVRHKPSCTNLRQPVTNLAYHQEKFVHSIDKHHHKSDDLL